MNEKVRYRLYREVLAAIIGSRISARDLRIVAELFAESGFAYELGRSIYELSRHSDPQIDFDLDENKSDQVTATTTSSLVDLAVQVIQRRKFSKARVATMLRRYSPRRSTARLEQTTIREMISGFFESATTSQTQDFLRSLGLDVSADPYLRGISDNSRK